jgi:cytochrome P450/CRP-like cAMP-binding protein
MRNVETVKLPPLVPGWPLIGNMLDLAAEPVQFWVDAAKKHGPAYRVRYPTAPNGEMTVLAGIDANRLAARQGHMFSNRQYFGFLAGEAGTANYMCALDGEDHAHVRKVMKPALSRESLAPVVPDLIRMVEEQTSKWQPGEIFSVSERLQRITVDGLAYAAGGAAIGEADYQHLCRFSKFFIGAGAAGWPRFLLKMPFYKKAKDAVHSYLKTMLRDHERRKPGTERRADTLDIVLNAAYRDGRPFNEADQLANAHLPYANGITYTGRVGAFLLYELLQRPELLARLRAEIDAAYSAGTPTMRELRNMTFLRNCVKEIIRYRPIAPAVPRFALQAFEFEGYSVPAGSFVFFAICVPHFDPNYFENPYQFDPDRYAAPRSEALRPYAYSPYGLGAHACLSMGLIETITMITTLGVLRTTELEVHPKDYKIRVIVNPMPGPSNVKFRVTERRKPDTRSRSDAADVEDTLAGFGLSSDDLKRFTAGVKLRTFENGETIIRQGDSADAFYVVMEGEVQVLRDKPDGTLEHLAHIGQAGYFGEIGLLHGVPRTATVRSSKERTQVLEIERDLFMHMVSEHDLARDDIADIARRRIMANQLADALPGLDAQAFSRVSEFLKRKQYPANDVVIRQGEQAENFYVIVSGDAEVLNEHSSGEDIVLAKLSAGDYFGEIGILQNRARTATVRAVSDLNVLVLDREHFLELSDADHRTGQSIAEKAVSRLLAMKSNGGSPS